MDVEPKANSNLLKKPNTTVTNGNLSHEEQRDPPDGGLRAYAVVAGSFLTNGLLFGIINSCSEIFAVLDKYLKDNNVPNAASRASLVGSLAMGITFLLSPLSGILTGLLGIRLTAILGGTIAATGMLLSSFVVHNVEALYFTYGIMYGFGASLAYTPSLAILGHYFKKRLGLVNGIVTIGSSVFTVIIPPIMRHVLQNHGLDFLFRLLAIFTFGIALCGLLFKPISLLAIKKSREHKGCKALLHTVIDVHIWKNKKYMIWALSMPVALFGYFVPYVLIVQFVVTKFPDYSETLPLQCIAATSGVGRLLFGFLADRPGIDRIMLQQISFYVIGTLIIIIPFLTQFGWLIAACLGIGLFDGAFISLIGPIAFELCGSAHAANAIGCMLGLAATPIIFGPLIAGYVLDLLGTYTVPFVLAGTSPLIGSTLMFAVRYCKRAPQDSASTNGAAIPPTSVHIERSPSGSLLNGKANHQSAL